MSDVTVSAAKTLDNGAKLVYVNHRGGRFNVQTPEVELAWDINCYNEGPYPKYSCEISFKGMEDVDSEDPVVKKRAEDIKGFHDKMVELEGKLVEEGVKNGVSWFKLAKNKVNHDVISSKFGPLVKVSKDKTTGEPDGKWPSTMKLKLQFRDNKFACKLVSPDGAQLDVNTPDSGHRIEDILVKGAKVKCIIQCVGLWVASGNYMCQWQLARAEVEVPESQGGDSFLPDSDDEDGVDGSKPKELVDSDDEDSDVVVQPDDSDVVEQPDDSENEPPDTQPTQLDDSDDEEEPKKTPPKVLAKKPRVQKKKKNTN